MTATYARQAAAHHTRRRRLRHKLRALGLDEALIDRIIARKAVQQAAKRAGASS